MILVFVVISFLSELLETSMMWRVASGCSELKNEIKLCACAVLCVGGCSWSGEKRQKRKTSSPVELMGDWENDVHVQCTVPVARSYK